MPEYGNQTRAGGYTKGDGSWVIWPMIPTAPWNGGSASTVRAPMSMCCAIAPSSNTHWGRQRPGDAPSGAERRRAHARRRGPRWPAAPRARDTARAPPAG